MIKRLNKIYNKKVTKFSRNFNLYYGLNEFQSNRLNFFLGYAKAGSLNKITKNEIINIENFIRKNYLLEHQLKLKIIKNIRELINLKTYKGFRHKYNLPVNGQKTRVNRMTCRKIKMPKIKKRFVEDNYKLLNLK